MNFDQVKAKLAEGVRFLVDLFKYALGKDESANAVQSKDNSHAPNDHSDEPIGLPHKKEDE